MSIMYAIIETGGRQFWVTPGETVRVEKLKVEAGKEVTLKALWAVGDAKEGQEPQVSRQATVVATVARQDRGPKIIVFKKRTKKAYKKTQGHRQWLTDLVIKSISFN
jgi:large subunit ribosomal protein L21